MICYACQAWITPKTDPEAGTFCCPECGFTETRRFPPLFIVSGASGTGKTALVPALQSLLPHWDVFETDILWDSGGDWNSIKCNWLRIAYSLLQAGRPVILCGTMNPQETDLCETRSYFSRLHYALLTCQPETLAERLRRRPAWRGFDEARIAEHLNYQNWFLERSQTLFDPPLVVFDTSDASVEEIAQQARDWATAIWDAYKDGSAGGGRFPHPLGAYALT